MGFFSKIAGEFVDVIEWTQPNDSGILVYRFPRHNHEIKMGAQLTVREGQSAVFVNEGQIADVFGPGQYELSTQNLPLLTTLRNWRHGFKSPFKAEVYFVVTTNQTGHKWGTTNPIMCRDSDFGMVRLRAFGGYVFKAVDPALIIRELSSTDPQFEDYEIDTQLKQVIVSRFSDIIGKSNIPVLDLVGNYEQLGDFVREKVGQDFAKWGIELSGFFVENISLPAAVEEALDRRTSMGVVGDLKAYGQFQISESLRESAQNGDSSATSGMGLGVGMAMAQQMAASTAQGQTTPPPLPQIQYHVAINGTQAGPFDQTQLLDLKKTEKLTKETLVWAQGMEAWQPAGKVPALSFLFGGPPPLPTNS